MKTYEITRYAFNELSDEAKDKAVQEWANRQDEVIDLFLPDDLMQQLENELGAGASNSVAFDLNLYYSLSYSQGDGVALDGSLTREDSPALPWRRGHRVYFKHSGHYYHERSFSVTVEDINGESIEDEEQEEITEAIRKVCADLRKFGYKLIDGYTSREQAIDELSEAGDIFRLDGSSGGLS